MTAYGVIMAGFTMAVHKHGDFVRGAAAESEAGSEGGWRDRAAVTIAIVLWLSVWLAGWWIGKTLSSGSLVLPMVGAFLGWCIGLAVATLVFYLDERL